MLLPRESLIISMNDIYIKTSILERKLRFSNIKFYKIQGIVNLNHSNSKIFSSNKDQDKKNENL